MKDVRKATVTFVYEMEQEDNDAVSDEIYFGDLLEEFLRDHVDVEIKDWNELKVSVEKTGEVE